MARMNENAVAIADALQADRRHRWIARYLRIGRIPDGAISSKLRPQRIAALRDPLSIFGDGVVARTDTFAYVPVQTGYRLSVMVDLIRPIRTLPGT